MAGTLGTLVTMVSADTSGFEAKMATAGQAAQSFEKKTTEAISSGTSRWGNEISKIGDKFTSFGGVLKLGFGVGTAKQMISLLHHGLMELGEGLGAAANGEITFGDALGDTVKKMLGMKTTLEEIRDAHKKAAEAANEQAAAEAKVQAALGNAPKPEFGALKGGDEAMAASHKAMVDARKAMGPAQDAVREQENRMKDNADLYRASPALDQGAKEELERRKRIAKPLEDAYHAAEIAYQRQAEELEKGNEDAADRNRRQTDHDDMNEAYWNQREILDKQELEAKQKMIQDTDETMAAYGAHQKELAASEKANAKDREDERKKALKDQLATGGVGSADSIRQQLQSIAAAANVIPDDVQKAIKDQSKATMNMDDQGVKVRNVEMLAYATLS